MRKKPSQLQLYRIKKGVLSVEVARVLKMDTGNYSRIESGWIPLNSELKAKIIGIIDKLAVERWK